MERLVQQGPQERMVHLVHPDQLALVDQLALQEQLARVGMQDSLDLKVLLALLAQADRLGLLVEQGTKDHRVVLDPMESLDHLVQLVPQVQQAMKVLQELLLRLV